MTGNEQSRRLCSMAETNLITGPPSEDGYGLVLWYRSIDPKVSRDRSIGWSVCRRLAETNDASQHAVERDAPLRREAGREPGHSWSCSSPSDRDRRCQSKVTETSPRPG